MATLKTLFGNDSRRLESQAFQILNAGGTSPAFGARVPLKLTESFPIYTLNTDILKSYRSLNADVRKSVRLFGAAQTPPFTYSNRWQHLLRFGSNLKAIAQSSAPGGESDLLNISSIATPNAELVGLYEKAFDAIDHQVPDDSYEARLLRLPSYQIVGIWLTRSDPVDNKIYIVSGPERLKHLQQQRMYSLEDFLVDLASEKPASGVKLRPVGVEDGETAAPVPDKFEGPAQA